MRLRAYIEPMGDKSITEKEIIDFCKGKIASFKIPRHVRFVDEWPMSSTKIQKYVLRNGSTKKQSNLSAGALTNKSIRQNFFY